MKSEVIMVPFALVSKRTLPTESDVQEAIFILVLIKHLPNSDAERENSILLQISCITVLKNELTSCHTFTVKFCTAQIC